MPIMMYLARGQFAFFKCVESSNDLAGAHLFSIAWLTMLHCFFFLFYILDE